MQTRAPRHPDLDAVPEEEPEVADLEEIDLDSDDGLIAPIISDDPEHDRVIDPED